MATPTPMAGEGTLAAVMPRSPPPPAATAEAEAAAGSAAEAPVLIFLYFHKAIRAELEGLHGAAVRLATERAGDVDALARRCRSFVSIYKHHCDAEDAVRPLPPAAELPYYSSHFVFLLFFPPLAAANLGVGMPGRTSTKFVGFRVAELFVPFGLDELGGIGIESLEHC
jgi:hypothetical protein